MYRFILQARNGYTCVSEPCNWQDTLRAVYCARETDCFSILAIVNA